MIFMTNRKFMLSLALAAILTLSAPLWFARATDGGTLTWPEDTQLTLDGPGIGLEILAGSQATSLSSTATTFTVTVPSGGSFTVMYPKPQPGSLSNDGGLPWCVYSGGNNIVTVSGPKTVTFTPTATPKCTASVKTDTVTDGTTGDTYIVPSVTIGQPNGGEQLIGDSVYAMTWSVSGSDIARIRILLSRDGGLTFADVIADLDEVTATYDWNVPNIDETDGKIMIEALDGTGRVMASDLSKRTFSITAVEEPQPEPIETPTEEASDVPPADTTTGRGSGTTAVEPEEDPTAEGFYDPEEALASTVSIDTDMGLTPLEGAGTICAASTLIKATDDRAVYYCGRDGKRYVFPNEKVYRSWFQDFAEVTEVDADTLAQAPPGGIVTYRPGKRLVKTQAEPQTYAVSRGGTLRWVENETVAELLYAGASSSTTSIRPSSRTIR